MALPDKDPDEKVVVTFDFTKLGKTVSSPEVSVWKNGFNTDLTGMKSGLPTVTGNYKVTQLIQGGENGVTYMVRCVVTAADSGEKFVAKDTISVKY